MRIKRCDQVDEDDVQIIYESPADEECQFIEVVNPPPGQSSKPSGSRTSVITGRKRPAMFPLPISSAVIKKPALEAGNFEQPLRVQPTTSQHSDESTIQNSSLWQQPSNSGYTGSAEQLPLGYELENSHPVIAALRTVSILLSSGSKPIHIFTQNANLGCWSGSSTSSTINMDFSSFVNQQGETFEQHNSQGTEEQAISMTTLSNIGSIQENMNIENNVANVNQRLTAFEQNSQETEWQTMNMILEPNPNFIQESINMLSEDTHSAALMNQQQETFEEDNSQETQQQGMSITTQSNATSSQESMEIASASENDNSSEPLTNGGPTEIPLADEQPRALEQNSEETEPRIISMIAHSNPQETINAANDSNYHFRAIPDQQQPSTQETQPQTMNVTVQESFVTNDTRHLRTFEPSDPQRQMVGSVPECNTAAIQGETSTSRNVVLSNQISQVTAPLDLTQTGDLLIPPLCQRLIIDGSFLKKTSQHLVWKGSLAHRKKTSSSATMHHLRCSIYGLKTVSGNMNVNADLWPRHLDLILLPNRYLLKQDLCKDLKNINRHTTIYFESQRNARMLQNAMINGWMGFIHFPPPCHLDIMIILYVPQKSVFMGFIANNETGFIIKLLDVYRNCGIKNLQKKFLPSGSQQAQTPPQPMSLPLPAHQQPTSSQLTHQQLPLASHQLPTSSQLTQQQLPLTSLQQPTSSQLANQPLPLPSHHLISSSEPDMPTSVLNFSSHIQRSTSHLPTGLPQSSHLQTSLPQSSHLQSSLPQSSHLQTSLPQSSRLQASLPQSSHLQTGLPQSSHLQTSLPQSSHLQTRPSTVLTCLPRTQQRLTNLLQNASEQVTVNKYETVDRHIDACISAIRQRYQLSHGDGPSTSQQAQASNPQISGTNNKTLLQTSGSANYLNLKLLESQASEIFSPSLVKKVMKKRIKTTKQSFTSVNELCDAILAYEEYKRKGKDSKKSKRDGNEALLCKICMDEQMNVVLEPCGHLSTCLDCSRPLEKCPMCRTIITNKRKIYMS